MKQQSALFLDGPLGRCDGLWTPFSNRPFALGERRI
jgi:hypothetical protein